MSLTSQAHRHARHSAFPDSRWIIAAIFTLYSVTLLSGCAGTPMRLVQRGEAPGSPPAGVTAVDGTRDATVAGGSLAGSWTEGAYYGNRKLANTAGSASAPSRSSTTGAVMRAAPQSHGRREQTGGAVRALHAQMAHLAPTLSGQATQAAALPGSAGGDTWSGAAPAPHGFDVASIAFNVPTAMTLERRALIQLALGAGQEPQAGGRTRTTTDAPQRIAQYIEARLSGGDFLIEAVTADTQVLGGETATEWLWLVTPKKPGKQQLHLTVIALEEAGGARQRRVLPTFAHTVNVGVAWQDALRRRVAAHEAWLWAALWLAPLALLWMYARWRRKHRRWFHGGL